MSDQVETSTLKERARGSQVLETRPGGDAYLSLALALLAGIEGVLAFLDFIEAQTVSAQLYPSIELCSAVLPIQINDNGFGLPDISDHILIAFEPTVVIDLRVAPQDKVAVEPSAIDAPEIGRTTSAPQLSFENRIASRTEPALARGGGFRAHVRLPRACGAHESGPADSSTGRGVRRSGMAFPKTRKEGELDFCCGRHKVKAGFWVDAKLDTHCGLPAPTGGPRAFWARVNESCAYSRSCAIASALMYRAAALEHRAH